MPFAIRMHRTGGPEVMCWEELEVADPAPGEARVRHQAVGLNYIDIYHRSGLYPLQLPNGLGLEAAGVVEAVGAGVSELRPGDRVAYAGGPVGAYSQVRCLPADRLLKLPETIDFRTAAAMMLQGLTSAYLLRRTYRVQAGDSVLIHAAAGGVGLIACQWAKALGATVIGTVSTAAKAALAAAHGCDHVIDYTREDFPGGSAKSPSARAWPWSTTGSARTPLPARSTACAPAGCWSASAMPPVRCRPSTRCCSRRRVRCF
jgi:NADPH2:quinone reductase